MTTIPPAPRRCQNQRSVLTPSPADSQSLSKMCCCTKQHVVIFIGLMEIIVAILSFGGLIYASTTFPQLRSYVMLPSKYFPDKLIVGLINGWAIICVFQLFLGLLLFDGAKHVKTGQLRFWLNSMLTYKVLICSLIIGIEIAGCRAPEFNTFIFFTAFVRFTEMICVFIFLEEEDMRRNRFKIRSTRQAISNYSSYSNLSIVMEEDEDRDIHNSSQNGDNPRISGNSSIGDSGLSR